MDEHIDLPTLESDETGLADNFSVDQFVEVDASTSLYEVLNLISSAPAIAIRFGGFADGRGFSLAASLRERGFSGELVATGDLIPDQAGLLRRAGFDRIHSETHQAGHRWARSPFSQSYQPAADAMVPAYRQRAMAVRRAKVRVLNTKYQAAAPDEIIAGALEAFTGRIAVLSSFGAEAAVGLSLLAKIDPAIPVLFVDTKRHFPQTLSYRDQLVAHLGLTNLKVLEPDPADETRLDSDQQLYARDGETCCDIRKVKPLARGLAGYDAMITGRKRYHGGSREELAPFEFDGERVTVNPFVAVTPAEFANLLRHLDAPSHPLVAQGFPSIGCWPCTAPSDGQTGARTGRWAGQSRNECGIFDAERVNRAERNTTRLI